MSWQKAGFGVFGLLLAAGCGGNVERGSRDPDPSEAESPKTGDAAAEVDPNADTELGECELGPTFAAAKTCAWVTDERCYDTREMACNCACPRQGTSQCISGFELGPNGRVSVSCG